MLRDYIQARGPALPNAPFFRSRRGRALSRGAVYERVRTWGRRARLGKPMSPHRLRHTFATHLVRAGVGLVTIRDLLGHRLITSTQIYLHVTAQDLRIAADSPSDRATAQHRRTFVAQRAAAIPEPGRPLRIRIARSRATIQTDNSWRTLRRHGPNSSQSRKNDRTCTIRGSCVASISMLGVAHSPRQHMRLRHANARHRIGWPRNRTKYRYDQNGNMTKRGGSTISYTSYNLPSVINSGSNSSTISYGAFRNRYKQVAVASGVTETTLYVAGLMEKVTRGSLIEYRHFIAGSNGTAAIHTRRSGGSPPPTPLPAPRSARFARTHHQCGGRGLVRPSFGAYGERRDGATGAGRPVPVTSATIANLTRRGFTGHEHLDASGSSHDGRVYEPVAGRFLSRDPFIDGFASSQGMNGYAYVHNNPLTYTDPSGFVLLGTVVVKAKKTGLEWGVMSAYDQMQFTVRNKRFFMADDGTKEIQEIGERWHGDRHRRADRLVKRVPQCNRFQFRE